MSFSKPFHRNYRPVVEDTNSGYSSWAYIVDRDYSICPEYYTRAFSLIQEDVLKLFEYVEPADINDSTYSFRIHELLMRTCIEVEANFKAILNENIYTPIYKKGDKIGLPRDDDKWNINDFRKVNHTHHLDAFSVELPFWKGVKHRRYPFKEWKDGQSLTWYDIYNKSKHDRINKFYKANFENLINAFSGLFVLLSSQFGTIGFSPGNTVLSVNVDSYYSGDFGIGDFLMINFPDDWSEDEMYKFNWSNLKNEKDRFSKFDYNQI